MTTHDEFGTLLARALFNVALFDYSEPDWGIYAQNEIDAFRAIAKEFGDAIIASEGEMTSEEWGDAIYSLMTDHSGLMQFRDEILALMHYEIM